MYKLELKVVIKEVLKVGLQESAGLYCVCFRAPTFGNLPSCEFEYS